MAKKKKRSDIIQFPTKDETGKWKPSDFEVPASDAQGHGSHVQFRIATGYARIAEEIFETHKFPFQTLSDLNRFCMVHGLRYLMEIEKEIPEKIHTHLSACRAAEKVVMDEEYRRTYVKAKDRLVAEVSRLKQEGEHSRAAQMIHDFVAELEKSSDIYYKKKILTELKYLYGDMVDRGKRVSLTATEED